MTENDLTKLSAEDQRVSDALRASLDRSVQDYDAATLSRLNQARQRALDALPQRRVTRWYWPALGLASALSLALLINLSWRSESTTPPASVSVLSDAVAPEDLALLASDDDLEMFLDLEFYAWLQQQPDWDGSSS